MFRRGQSLAWHALPRTPPVVTHGSFQAQLAHAPSHAHIVELTHHHRGHRLRLAQSPSSHRPPPHSRGLAAPQVLQSQHLPPPKALPSTPTRRRQEPLGGARSLLHGRFTVPSWSGCPGRGGGGSQAAEGCASRQPAGGTACCSATSLPCCRLLLLLLEPQGPPRPPSSLPRLVSGALSFWRGHQMVVGRGESPEVGQRL